MANLIPTKAPNLLVAPAQYETRYQEQLNNILRLYFNQIDNFNQNITVPSSGTTANRPTDRLQVGQTYFDTTILTLILWDGTAWVSAVPSSASAITGAIQMWATGTAPTGYLLCDGASVSTTTYAALFAVIGYTFGGSGGSFLLPNYTNRMPYGTTIGATGGSADAVVVSHTHTASVSDPGHQHLFGGDDQIGPQGGYNAQSGVSYDASSTTSGGAQNYYTKRVDNTNNPQTTGISVSNSTTGSSGTNANLPPYLGINFIIKT